MKTKELKHNPEWNEPMLQGETDLQTPCNDSLQDRCPYLFSSNYADAYWITAWAVYHTGKRPYALHKSRGHTWKAHIHNMGIVILIVDSPDQRDGIRII